MLFFGTPYTRVMYGDQAAGSATGKQFQVRLVHSLLKYLFKFQLWYWIQIYTTKYSNLLLIILIISLNCLQHEKEKFWCKSDMSPANLFTVTCHTKWSRSGNLDDANRRIAKQCQWQRQQLWQQATMHCQWSWWWTGVTLSLTKLKFEFEVVHAWCTN